MAEVELFLDRKRYEGCDCDSFGIEESIVKKVIDEGNTPKILLKEEDIYQLVPSFENAKHKPVAAFILGRDEQDFSIDEDYARSILKSGIQLRFISYDDVERQMENVDGLILPGGFFDSPPQWYEDLSAKPDLQSIRSMTYVRSILKAKEKEMPLLGICAGMQMIAGMYSFKSGVALIQNINNKPESTLCHTGIPKPEKAHDVTIYKGTKLYDIVGSVQIPTNSNHNEAIIRDSIDNNYSEVKVAALSSDGIVEAIELKSYPTFALGLQWHPETWASRYDDKVSQNIFDSFGKSCLEYQKKKLKAYK